MLVLFLSFVCTTACTPQTGTVTGKRWTCTITYQRYKCFTEEGWEVPLGGTIIQTQSKKHGYYKVVDELRTWTDDDGEVHQEASYRRLPKYDTWYTYTIWRWAEDTSLTQQTAGDYTDSRVWPTPLQETNTLRIYHRTQMFYVYITNEHRQKRYTVSEDLWNTLSIDSSIHYIASGDTLRIVENKTNTE